ncbi:MAG: glycosyltransferase family 4 protein [Anaerolineae bacterium]|nr:glycosyltransferase family 4 protein [Anaerolineae bacterium]
MRIGLITGEYPPMQGGVGAFTYELARQLHALGHEVHVFTSRAARPSPPEGVRVSWRTLNEPVEVPYGWLYPRARRWGWGDMGTIADIALRYELEVVNIQYQAAAYNMRSAAINLAPWRLRGLTTVVTTFHDLRVPYLFPRAGGLRTAAVRQLARGSHGVIVTNRPDYEQVLAWGMDAATVRRIPIGSNIARRDVSPDILATVRRQLGLRPIDQLAGYFGFLHESKGADLLLEALAALPETVHLVFIGGRTGDSDRANNEEFVAKLDRLIAELDLTERVHWTGFVEDAEVSAFLQASDVVVLPYRDGISLRRGTLMAALAHGRPVLSTLPEEPVAELGHGESVWLVPAGDSEALATALERLLADGALRAQLGAAAGETAEMFSWERIAAETAAFFSALRTA